MCLPRARPLSCPTLTVSRRLTPLPLPECESACAILLTRLPPNITPRRGCLARTVRMEPISRGHTLMVHRKPPRARARHCRANLSRSACHLPPWIPGDGRHPAQPPHGFPAQEHRESYPYSGELPVSCQNTKIPTGCFPTYPYSLSSPPTPSLPAAPGAGRDGRLGGCMRAQRAVGAR